MLNLIKSVSDLRGELIPNAPLAPLTWFKVGGPAELLFIPKDKLDLIQFFKSCPFNIPITIIGAGSNILIREGGVPGIVVSLKNLNQINNNNGVIYAECGALDMAVSREASKLGITGLEFLIGIPGSIGGALKMNAGSYGYEIKDILLEVEGIDRKGNMFFESSNNLSMEYRKSNAPEDWIFLSCKLKGELSSTDKVRLKMKQIMDDRKNNQPINQLTSGSTFKNPVKNKSWKLIDESGCRGLSFGDAKVSEKHCNFLINKGNAQASDIEALGEIVRNKVLKKTGIDLQWEIIRIGIEKSMKGAVND
jgi:UDP-N-acetylmuramate dehydrogenase